MTLDGGANAIRGFNYQKVVISLIAIFCYQKDGFRLYVENQDDVDVLLTGYHFFIQIKSSKLSISSMLSLDRKQKKSILGKNLSKTAEDARYKIVGHSFNDNDKKKLIESNENAIFDKTYEYNDEQKHKIIESLKLQGFNEKYLKDRLDKSYIFFCPLSDHDTAIRYLKGCMSEKNLSVDFNTGTVALNELFTMIDSKSEIRPTDEEPYKKSKQIVTEDLLRIFTTSSQMLLREKILKDLKAKEILNLLEQKKVSTELLKIQSHHKAKRQNIVNQLGSITINEQEYVLIQNLYNQIDNFYDKCVTYALLIDIVADRIQEESE